MSNVKSNPPRFQFMQRHDFIWTLCDPVLLCNRIILNTETRDGLSLQALLNINQLSNVVTPFDEC